MKSLRWVGGGFFTTGTGSGFGLGTGLHAESRLKVKQLLSSLEKPSAHSDPATTKEEVAIRKKSSLKFFTSKPK